MGTELYRIHAHENADKLAVRLTTEQTLSAQEHDRSTTGARISKLQKSTKKHKLLYRKEITSVLAPRGCVRILPE